MKFNLILPHVSYLNDNASDSYIYFWFFPLQIRRNIWELFPGGHDVVVGSFNLCPLVKKLKESCKMEKASIYTMYTN